jgi:endonuclease/exonuclease/phosphatase family metal-dependent hydrolase
MNRTIALATVALIIAMGVHVLRSGLAMVVWNIAVEQPAAVLALIALAIWITGLAGWLLEPRKDPVRWIQRMATIFALGYAISHLIADRTITPVLAVLSLITWFWLVPVIMDALARYGMLDVLAPGILLGFALQIALQTALHGLDLSMLRGILPGIGAVVLGGVLIVTTYAIKPGLPDKDGSTVLYPGWGMLALGPFLALQFTLLANLGRAQLLSGWGIAFAAIPIMLGLASGAALQPLVRSRIVQITAAIVPIVLLQPALLQMGGLWLVSATQLLLAIAVAAAFASTGGAPLRRPHVPGAVGMLLLFVLTFLFYSRYEWVTLWPIMAALVAFAVVLWGRHSISFRAYRVALSIVLVGVIGIGLGLVAGPSGTATSAQEQTRVMTYNIRMGFDGHGVPHPAATARVVEALEVDVVALQEVGRGWTVNGGVDLVAWLHWRFPSYHLVYGPMNGDLWGNVILSRYEIRDSGSVRFLVRESQFQRGLTWALVSSPGGDLLIINAHLAHDSAADRLAQAQDILAFWRGRERTILLGDFNEGPDSPPIRRLLAAGFEDALGPHGLGTTFTFPSVQPSERLDYILVSRDLRSAAGSIQKTTASDHLPVLADIRFR